jgi:hypothetical protein
VFFRLSQTALIEFIVEKMIINAMKFIQMMRKEADVEPGTHNNNDDNLIWSDVARFVCSFILNHIAYM